MQWIRLIDAVGRSLRESFLMFWATLWPLVLGFGLSGAVQAFVSRDAMRRVLGSHRPAAVARAAGFGMASSSCSYAASAMARSLFARGADFVAAQVFMFASTNLVIELGVVLVVLMGWQFAVSEFVGGIIMIVLLSLIGGLWLRGRLISQARQRQADEAATPGSRGDQADSAGHHGDMDHSVMDHGDQARPGGWRTRIRSRSGLADAASYTMSDLTMLRRELVIGYLVAGFLATLVPSAAWRSLFLSGHGLLTSAENALIGPFIAVISFVCSIGNVPLAAALWHGGISFSGVVSFIFADLITFPLLLIYRRYYGTRLALRMLAVFWAVMSLAGLITEGIFRAAGLVPASRTIRIGADHLAWNYTTWLNIAFLAGFAVWYWLYRSRQRLGDDGGHARDPVCGMRVEIAQAPASVLRDGQRSYFCSSRCRDRFAERDEPAGPGQAGGPAGRTGRPGHAGRTARPG